MGLETVTQKIKEKMSLAGGLDATIVLDFKDDGQIFIDTTQSPAVISHDVETDEPDLKLSCKIGTFEDILSGKQDPNIAFMMGKLKIKGSMGLAMKLNSIIED